MLARGTVTRFHECSVAEKKDRYESECPISKENSPGSYPSKVHLSSDDEAVAFAPLDNKSMWSYDRKLSFSAAEESDVTWQDSNYYDDVTSSNFLQSSQDGTNMCERKWSENDCNICHEPVTTKFVHLVSGRRYHEACLKCSICGESFGTSCFFKEGAFYCQEHYTRIWKTCRVCNREIQKGEKFVKLITSYLCHVACFRCGKCGLTFQTGDKCHIDDIDSRDFKCENCWQEPTVSDENVFASIEKSSTSRPAQDPVQSSTVENLEEVTKTNNRAISPSLSSVESSKSEEIVPISDEDDKDGTTKENSANNETDGDRDDATERDEAGRVKRPRTILTQSQRKAFDAAFKISPKPCRKIRESLAAETGLTTRVVQVWFQNQRAKVKKIAKRRQGHGQILPPRDRYGCHAYAAAMPLNHPMFPDSMVDMRFNTFQNHQEIPVWERGVPLEFYQTMQHTAYSENAHLNDVTVVSDAFIPSTLFHDYGPQESVIIDSAMIQGIPGGNISAISDTTSNQPINDLRASIDDLYPMQEQYYVT